jgi:hypothetical protein
MDHVEELVKARSEEIYFGLRSIGIVDSWESFWSMACKKGSPFHPTGNAVHWLVSTWKLHREIVYAYASMEVHARRYKEAIAAEAWPSHTDGFVSYFADDCTVRLDAVRDKLALGMLSLYDAVDVSKRVPDCHGVISRLENYERSGEPKELWLDPIVKSLKSLNGSPWGLIENLRTLKIHRLEPRIELYGARAFHKDRYLAKIESKEGFDRLRDRVTELYGTGDLAEIVFHGCSIDGIFYSDDGVDRVFGYDEIEKTCFQCMTIVSSALSACFKLAEAELSQL